MKDSILTNIATLLHYLLTNAAGLVEHDPQWTSPSVILPADHENMVQWRPVAIERPTPIAALPLRPEIIAFYTSFWGWGWEGMHGDDVVMLRTAWNADDLAQIAASLADQVAAGKPIFIANTDSDTYVAVDNASGAVVLCEPGEPPTRQIAPSLSSFLASLCGTASGFAPQ